MMKLTVAVLLIGLSVTCVGRQPDVITVVGELICDGEADVGVTLNESDTLKDDRLAKERFTGYRTIHISLEAKLYNDGLGDYEYEPYIQIDGMCRGRAVNRRIDLIPCRSSADQSVHCKRDVKAYIYNY